MNLKSFYLAAIDSLQDLIKNPLIAIISGALYIFLFLFSSFSFNIQPSLTNSISQFIWLGFYILVSILALSATSFFLTIFSIKIIKKGTKTKEYLKLKIIFNFLISFIILIVVFMLINLISNYSAFILGKTFLLSTNLAVTIYILIYLALTLGVLIFLTFSTFFVVIQKASVPSSIKLSFKLVKSNYLNITILGISLLVLNFILSEINSSIVADLINYIIIFPYLFILLTRLVLHDLSTKR